MAKLTLSLLGRYEVTANGVPVQSFESDKVRGLLAFLAIEGGTAHRRESLCGLFWPDKPERLARRSLSQSLYNLQSIISNQNAHPPFLLISQPEVRFNLASNQWVDANTFVNLLLNTQKHNHAELKQCSVCREALQNAIHLYQGEFLKGLSIGDSPLFEEWLLLKRERLNYMAIQAIQQLIDIYQHHHQYQEALPYARRWVELDPLQEEAYYLLLKLLARCGKRSEALAQFEQCRMVLMEELGVEPAAKLVKLTSEIRSGMISATPGAHAESPLLFAQKSTPKERPGTTIEIYNAAQAQRSSLPLLAREREIARLHGFLNMTLSGLGQVVFVTGEAGRGKTALLNAFTRESQERHEKLVVLGGSCKAYNGSSDSYYPFREILGLLTGDTEHVRNSTASFGTHSNRLSELFPSTVQTLIEGGAHLLDNFVATAPLLKRIARVSGGAEWHRQLLSLLGEHYDDKKVKSTDHEILINEFSKVLEQLAHVQPLLIVLDNLQWADVRSLNLLFHLGMRIKDLPILILAAYRPSEITRQHADAPETVAHPLALIVDEFKRQFGNIEIQLSRESDQLFVDAFLNRYPNHLDDQFREALDWKTGGNPLFVIELIHNMQEHGDLVPDREGIWQLKATVDWERLPQRIDAVIGERMRHLSQELRNILEIASVEGEIFTAEVVAQALAIDVQQVIQQLSGALTHQHRLVRAHGVYHVKQAHSRASRLCRYRFRQPIVQQYLYQHLDQVQRALLHEAVGNAIEAIYGPEENALTPVAAQLTHHFRMADLTEKAITYWFLACGRVLSVMVPNEATHMDPVEQ